jgi:hypothetical protein
MNISPRVRLISICVGLIIWILQLSAKTAELTSPMVDTVVATADTNACSLSDTFTPEVLHWKSEICDWSEEHDMDPDLIATIMQIESCGHPTAVSSTGVRGLFQVTGANLDGQDPFDPNVSMAKGPGKVLKYELDATNGDIRSALAGYNGGPWARQWINGEITTNQFISRLRNHGSGNWRNIAKARAKVNEVQRYAQWSNIYFEAKNNQTDTLNEWLDLGGARLCASAATKLGIDPNLEPIFASDKKSKS